jgi:rubrerythrin
MTKDELLEALQDALTFEEEGTKFYAEEANKAVSKITREALLDLAKMEVEHGRRIKDAYQSIQKSGKLSGKEIGTSETMQQALKTIFNRISKDLESLKKQKGQNFESDEDVLISAANLEVRGLNMYQESLEQATEDGAIEFFQWLVNEEKMHYDLLIQTKHYLANPDTWFTVGEHDRGLHGV